MMCFQLCFVILNLGVIFDSHLISEELVKRVVQFGFLQLSKVLEIKYFFYFIFLNLVLI